MSRSFLSSWLRKSAPELVATATPLGKLVLGQDYRHLAFEQSVQHRSQQHLRVQGRPQQPPLKLNPVQLSMYQRVFYGLKQYSAEEMAGMDRTQIERIHQDFERGKYLLHKLKVDVYLAPETKLLNAIWPRLHLGSKPTDYHSTKLPTQATLSRLKISMRQIVNCFMENNLLPKDFWDLTPTGISL